MIKIPLKLSSDFRTKKQEASPKVVPVVHNSPSVLEQNRNTDLFFYPKLHLKHRNVHLVIPADELVVTGECVDH